ncbi:hypothetical protein [Vibrio parahaemolyticus]|uniref:hypothetical protein n=1 Tax=Vibrio parahaemolyticus TaxID=670 RepID=UPI001DB86A1D|nr:hypothetical protein [Vibrio parahaemolyticus]EJG1693040.1 hypothetical protein [Vibrio parahaemolyticus]HCE2306222.1 hypothetical protein [Vibrio parahaemolyticus]
MVELDEFLFKQFHDDVRLGISQELKLQNVELDSHPICVKVIVAYMSIYAAHLSMEDFLSDIATVKSSYVDVYGFGETETDISAAVVSMQSRIDEIKKVVISYVSKDKQ